MHKQRRRQQQQQQRRHHSQRQTPTEQQAGEDAGEGMGMGVGAAAREAKVAWSVRGARGAGRAPASVLSSKKTIARLIVATFMETRIVESGLELRGHAATLTLKMRPALTSLVSRGGGHNS